MRRLLSGLSALVLLCAPGFSLAYTKNADGLYVDDSGQVIADYWDDAAGIYIVEGVGYAITDSDSDTGSSSYVPSPESSSGAITVGSSDGAADPTAGLQHNPDGSVTVESGQIQIDDSSSESGPHLTEAEWAARWAKYSAKNGTTTGTVYMDSTGNTFPAEILALGLGRSTIQVDGEKMLVATSSLRWDTEAPDDKLLAVVTPKSQSYITLRAKKSKKSFVMGHCDKCKVLRVISTGKTWTMVDDEGVRGYVLTSGLTFYDNQPKQYAAGLITIKGKVPRGDDHTVHVRSSNTKGARQIAEYNAGTPVTVFSQDEKWTEIDVDGLHCYILSEFVTLQEPLLLAEATAEAALEN
ncbi:MAG: hypothetical protein II888_02755 [Clostridia bacterium]|nr:hypothetical protein [Clostridia bacterium]